MTYCADEVVVFSPQTEVYFMRPEICIDRGTNVTYVLNCDDPPGTDFPESTVQWRMNGELLVNTTRFRTPFVLSSFFAPGTGREIFYPWETNPPVLSLESHTVISLRTQLFNVSFLARNLHWFNPPEQLNSIARNAIMGEWTCEKRNTYGSVSATTTIQECGK